MSKMAINKKGKLQNQNFDLFELCFSNIDEGQIFNAVFIQLQEFN